MKTYTVSVYRPDDVENVLNQLLKANVRWYNCMLAPFYNTWGEQISTQYIFVYQHDKELSIEVQN